MLTLYGMGVWVILKVTLDINILISTNDLYELRAIKIRYVPIRKHSVEGRIVSEMCIQQVTVGIFFQESWLMSYLICRTKGMVP